MARSGIYKSEVAKARQNLVAMEIYPSIDAVRAELGNTGSKTTIHRYLKEIEEEEGGHQGEKLEVSEAILDLSTRLAKQLQQEAHQQIAVFTDKHNADITELNKQISELKQEVASLKIQSDQLTVDLATEQAEHAETRIKLQDESLSATQANQRIVALEAQLTREEEYNRSLNEKHQHAREALEHFRTAAKEQREQDHRQFEQQIQFLQSELRAAQNMVNTKQQELIGSHENNARLASELKHSRSEFYRISQELQLLGSVKQQLGVAELQNQQLQSQLIKAGERETELMAENKTTAENLQAETIAAQQAAAELVTTKAILATHEQILQMLVHMQND